MFQRDPSRTNTISDNYISYLDVSQYILKEYSPQFKPLSPHHPHDQEFPSPESFQLQPIELGQAQIILTPVTKGLIRQQVQDILDDFMLEQSSQKKSQDILGFIKRKEHRSKLKMNNQLELFRFECDLDRIIEYDEQESFVSQFQSSLHSESQGIPEFDNCYANSNTFHTVYSAKPKIKTKITRDTEEQNKTALEAIAVDYCQKLENFSQNPKTQIMKGIRQIQLIDADEEQKKILIKRFLKKYLLEHQIEHFQQTWLEFESPLKQIIALIQKGLEESFGKRVGPISFQQRRVKLLKYLQKKKSRIWKKKVNYDCRKKVADGRLRIRGKFVTREQACLQLGFESLGNYKAQQIKQMIQRKIEGRINQFSF